MKANELMIGDLVSYSNEPFQVDYYHRITDTIGLRYKGKSPNFQDGVICAEAATPIPLTAEILERNGLDKVMDGVFGELCNIMTFHYVHELQHALRLCGLNELADNFKI